MTGSFGPFICVLFICLTQQVLCNKRCFTCNRVAHPRDCTRVSICGPTQECSIEQKVTPDGHIFYNTGCKDTQACAANGQGRRSLLNKRTDLGKEFTSCIECCNSEFCNYGGCGQPPLPPRNQRGPICYNCQSQPLDSICNEVTVCERDCECHIMKVPDLIYDHVYKSGCASKTACHASLITGRKRAIGAGSFCFSCCNDDFCNNNCSTASHPPVTTQQPTQPIVTPAPGCPANTVERGHSCYFFSTAAKYWNEAKQLCNLKNGALLKIEDKAENDFIIQQLKARMSTGLLPADLWGYYIGASLNVANQWVWTDGSPLNYHDWGNGEPDLPNDQRYGFIFLPGHYAGDYKWGSHKDMQGTSRYICEIPH